MGNERTARAWAQAERRKRILSDFWDGIKGEPLDVDDPWAELWIVAAVALLPAYALLEVVL